MGRLGDFFRSVLGVVVRRVVSVRPTAPVSVYHGPHRMPMLLTMYYPVSEDDYHDPTRETVEVAGTGKRTYLASFVRAVRMEGAAGRTRDGIIQYDGTRFVMLDAQRYPWGMNALGGGLLPYQSVAVDPEVIPLRTVLDIPEVKGLTIQGRALNGHAVAVDTGGAIKGNRIDYFVESATAMRELAHQMEPLAEGNMYRVTVAWDS